MTAQTDDYAALLPLLSTAEMAALRTDIKSHGVRHPVLVDEDGNVLDGRHRLKIDPKAPREVISGLTPGEKQALVYRLNLARRNLSPDQKRDILAGMKATAKLLREEDAKKWTQKRVAQELGVARQTVTDWFSDAATTTNAASGISCTPDARVKVPAKQKPIIAERVAEGESQAQVAADYGVTQQAVAKIVKAEAKKAEGEARKLAQAQAAPGEAKAWLANCTEWLPTQPECDLLLTDPPYSTDVDDIAAFAAEWLPVALAKVKPTGRAFVCIGAYPQELAAYLSVAMPAQILVWTYRNTLGPSPTYDYKLNWQAILYYRMPEAPALDCPVMLEQFSVQDISAPDGRQNNRYHAWQKPDELAERLIRHTTQHGNLVLDPFCCTGTFLLAAAKLGRLGRGCDLNMDVLQIAKERGCVVEAGFE